LLEHTTDGGRSWQLQVKPEYLSPTPLLLAMAGTLVIDSHAGTLRSNDQGRTWVPTPAPSLRAVAQALHEPAYIRILASNHTIARDTIAEVSPDGGRTWRALRVPASLTPGIHKPSAARLKELKRLRPHFDLRRFKLPHIHFELVGDVSFIDADQGLIASGEVSEGGIEGGRSFADGGRVPVFATRDAGARWRQLRLPHGVERRTPVTLGPGVVLINPPQQLRNYSPPLLYLSTDEGQHWATLPISNHYWECSVSRPRHQDIWVLCAFTSASQNGAAILLRSDNGGSTWRKLTGPAPLSGRHLVALSAQEAWASGQQLWHTTDGGNTWQEVWPNIPGTFLRER
jgi:photosystem II stability/assembly factor-like uncharacterized protein